jgi:glyoxylate/hydroxypyruvate reductase A
MTAPRSWSRLLVLGRACEDIAKRVRARRPDLEVTARGMDDVTADDLRRAEMLLAFRIPPHVRHAADHLAWIQSTGAGVDGLLSSTSFPPHTLLTRVVGVFGKPMSEYVLLRCLAIAQDLDRQRRAQRNREWDVFYPRLLDELDVLVLGTGEIGGEIGRNLARNGVRVVGANRRGSAVAGFERVIAVSALAESLSRFDVLVVVVPDTADTRGMIGQRELRGLKRGAWIVNVARGSCVDEMALLDALREGHLGGAALDVFAEEPLPSHSPLWELQNVWVSPHVSGLTKPEQAADAFLENLARFECGEEPRGQVDPTRGY